MKTIFLVRHGESDANIGTHYSDETAPLTAKGRQQAAYIAERVSRLPVDALLSSTMGRARETAGYISDMIGKSIEFTDLVVERKYPTSLVGLARGSQEGNRVWNDWTASCFSDTPRVEDGENFEDLKSRALSLLSLLEKRPENNILIVTHGSFSKFICAGAIYGVELSPDHTKDLFGGLRINYTGLSVLHHDPTDTRKTWWVSVWNDHAHLG